VFPSVVEPYVTKTVARFNSLSLVRQGMMFLLISNEIGEDIARDKKLAMLQCLVGKFKGLCLCGKVLVQTI